MATVPTPSPAMQQVDAPTNGAPQAVSGGDQQGNQLQQMLGKLMKVVLTLAQQNEIISPEMQEAATAFRKAFLKTAQGGQQPQQGQAPPGM